MKLVIFDHPSSAWTGRPRAQLEELASIFRAGGVGGAEPRKSFNGSAFGLMACLAVPCRGVGRAFLWPGSFGWLWSGMVWRSGEGGAEVLPGGRDRCGPAPGGVNAQA